jgi:hypothetical protein
MSSFCRTDTSVRLAWSTLEQVAEAVGQLDQMEQIGAPLAIALLEPLDGCQRVGGEAVEQLGERGHGSPELQHLAGEPVDALGWPGLGGGEDRLRDLLDGVVERVEDGTVAVGGVVDDVREHRGQPGTGPLRVVLQVLAGALQHDPVAVDADHEAVTEHQLDFPTLTASSAATQVVVLTTATSSSPLSSSTGRAAVARLLTSEVGRPNSR